MQVERLYKVFVVKGGPVDLRTGQLYGIHVRHRRYGSSAAYLIGYLLQSGAHSLGFELIGYRPSWTLGRKAQIALLAYGVDLKNNAIGGNRKIAPFLVPIVDEIVNSLQRLHLLHPLANLETPRARSLKAFVMSLNIYLVAKKIVQVCVKATFGNHSRVLAFQRAAGSIPWIGKRLGTYFFTFFVESVEGIPGHENFSANLKILRIAQTWLQNQGDRAYSLNISGYIIALYAVSASYSLYQSAVLIGKGNGQTVIFHLAADLEVLALQSFFYLVIPFLDVSLIVGIGKREHRIAVSYLLKLLRDVAAHTHGGGVGIV